MPAIDNLFGNGAIHIADQNKLNPVATLCGQALDKDTIRYFEAPQNFHQATCKVCRKSYFDEPWTGEQQRQEEQSEPRQQEQQEEQQQEQAQDPPVEPAGTRSTLFSNLTPVVNRHGPDGDPAAQERQ